MGNGFRRIALAQGLLSEEDVPEVTSGWTDAEVSALLQVDETPPATEGARADRRLDLQPKG